ncbi:hypothetical protein, partial [Streptomyces sp. BE303]|uniref:hypothetical protein n=1 Tax=Streptomyces sp. BE303 TaxID=3002528 RepID=UPI002E798CC6
AGLPAPHGPSLQGVLCAAVAAARLSPQDDVAVEAHGTGPTLAAAAARRAALAHRAVVLDGDTVGLTTGLGALASGSGCLKGVAGSGRVAFLFTGQGAQRASMGRGLYEAFPVFADAFDQ